MKRKIVKYSNRKLYDKITKKYVNLSQLVKLPMGSFQVIEHTTKKDITTETLLGFLGNYRKESKNDAIRIMTHCINALSVG